MRKLALTALAVMGLTGPALAAEISDFEAQTTGDFASLCSTAPSDELYEQAQQFCLGFVRGAAGFYSAVLGPEGIDPIACPGSEVTFRQAIDVFLAWDAAHPELRQEEPIQGLMRAAKDEWPCPE
jgi:hypothetical protein